MRYTGFMQAPFLIFTSYNSTTQHPLFILYTILDTTSAHRDYLNLSQFLPKPMSSKMEQEQAASTSNSPPTRQISAQNPPTPSSRASSPQISPQNATTNGIHEVEETEKETSNSKDTFSEDAKSAANLPSGLGNAITYPSPYTNLSVHSLTHEMVFGPIPDREYHEGFMRKAIEMAQLALDSDETPVGCVFVRDGEVIGRGINGTNASLNVSTETFSFCF
jgi:hypothetical protein